MSFKQYENPLYFCVARNAARTERKGEYRLASRAWTLAGQVSNHKTNQQWSENRAAFCLRQTVIQEESEEAIQEALKEAIPDDVPA